MKEFLNEISTGRFSLIETTFIASTSILFSDNNWLVGVVVALSGVIINAVVSSYSESIQEKTDER